MLNLPSTNGQLKFCPTVSLSARILPAVYQQLCGFKHQELPCRQVPQWRVQFLTQRGLLVLQESTQTHQRKILKNQEISLCVKKPLIKALSQVKLHRDCWNNQNKIMYMQCMLWKVLPQVHVQVALVVVLKIVHFSLGKRSQIHQVHSLSIRYLKKLRMWPHKVQMRPWVVL